MRNPDIEYLQAIVDRPKDEGRVVYTPLHTTFPTYTHPVNPDYPSCPLGMRVSDLPRGWASAGDVMKGEVGRHRPPSNGHPKLTPHDVVFIKEWIKGGGTSTELVKTYGVHKSTISRIVRGQLWA